MEKQDDLSLYYVTEKNFPQVTGLNKYPYLSLFLRLSIKQLIFLGACVWGLGLFPPPPQKKKKRYLSVSDRSRKFNCSTMASVVCHRAVGKYLYNLHDNKFIFERSYLLLCQISTSFGCDCRKLTHICFEGLETSVSLSHYLTTDFLYCIIIEWQALLFHLLSNN